MTDPTIPELVARLRELLSKAHPLPWLYRGKSDSLHVAPPEPPFSYGAGFLRLTEYDDAEATDEDIDLILEAVNALPAILDALERQGPHLESLTTWRPIDECGELEAGAEYLVRMKHADTETLVVQVCELITIARWSGAEWQVRIVDAERYRAEHIAHVHCMGPVRGPGVEVAP